MRHPFLHYLMGIAFLAMAGEVMAQASAPSGLPALPGLPSGTSPLPFPGGPAAPPSASPAVPAPVVASTGGAGKTQAPPPASSAALPAMPKVKPVEPSVTASAPQTDANGLPLAAGDEKEFSYGRSNLSVLFLPAQIVRMKESLRAYEMINTDNKPATIVAPVETIAAPVEQIKEPDNYPVFFLSSIAYNSPADWSLWISGHKITSRQNTTDVQVISVSRDGATFSWKPAYAEAISRRRTAKQFVPTDGVKNKLAVVQNLSQDEKTAMVTFSLKQNQTFAVAYFSIFEGYMETAKLPAYTGVESMAVSLDDSSPLPGTPAPSSTRLQPNGNATTNAATIAQAEDALLHGTPMTPAPAPAPVQPAAPRPPTIMQPIVQPPGMPPQPTAPAQPGVTP